MEGNVEKKLESQELEGFIWFGQIQILGELVNADLAKAQSEPNNARAIARKITFSLKEHIDNEKERISNTSYGRIEVFVASVQLLSRYINADYQRAINYPEEAVKFAFDQAICSLLELDEELKKESELTED